MKSSRSLDLGLVPKEAIQRLDALRWIRDTQREVANLPQGKLRLNLEEDLNNLLGMPSEQQLHFASLEDQIRTLKSTNAELADECDYLRELQRPEVEIREVEGPLWKPILVTCFLTFIATLFLIRGCSGANLDLGDARRSPDALALPTPYGERNTQDAEISAAPGKSRVPPVDYRHSTSLNSSTRGRICEVGGELRDGMDH